MLLRIFVSVFMSMVGQQCSLELPLSGFIKQMCSIHFSEVLDDNFTIINHYKNLRVALSLLFCYTFPPSPDQKDNFQR